MCTCVRLTAPGFHCGNLITETLYILMFPDSCAAASIKKKLFFFFNLYSFREGSLRGVLSFSRFFLITFTSTTVSSTGHRAANEASEVLLYHVFLPTLSCQARGLNLQPSGHKLTFLAFRPPLRLEHEKKKITENAHPGYY